MRTKRWLVGLSVATAAVVAVAGCSSSKKATGGDSSSGSASVKTPLKILTYGDYTTNGATTLTFGAEARVAYLNAHGGIGGRQVELTSCDSKGDPNVLTSCLRTAISDGVVAAVGGGSALAAVSMKILQDAKIPLIGLRGGSPDERSNPYSLCIVPSTLGIAQGMASQLAKVGAKKVTILDPAGIAATAEFQSAFKATGTAAGMSVVKQTYPLTITDWTPTIAQALSSGQDGIGVVGVGPAFAGGVRQMVAKNVKFDLYGELVTSDFAASVKDVSAPITAIDFLKPAPAAGDTSYGKLFTSDMKTYEPGKDLGSHTIQNWLGVYALEQIAKTIKGDIDSASIYKAQFSISDLDTDGFTPKVNTAKKNAGGEGNCIVNSAVAVNVVTSGTIGNKVGFIDPLTGKTVS